MKASNSRGSSLCFENTPVYKENQLESNQYSSERTQAIEFIVLALFYLIVVAAYCLAYMMLSRLGGNIFVNSIVLSFAESFSMGITGLGMTYFKDTDVSRCCAVIMGVFNAIYYYYTDSSNPLLQYAVLFLALVG